MDDVEYILADELGGGASCRSASILTRSHPESEKRMLLVLRAAADFSTGALLDQRTLLRRSVVSGVR